MSPRKLDKQYPQHRITRKGRRLQARNQAQTHAYGKLIRLTSVLLIGIGASLAWKTWRMSHGDVVQIGYLLGFGMIAAGVARLVLQRRLEAPLSGEPEGADGPAADELRRGGGH